MSAELRRSNYRKVGVPGDITTGSVLVIMIAVAGSLRLLESDRRVARKQVIKVYAAVGGPRINIALPGRRQRGKLTPNQRLVDSVPLKSEHRRVSRVLFLSVRVAVLGAPPIVKVRVLSRLRLAQEPLIADHLAHIPHLQQLIFPVTGQVDAIAPGRDIGDALCVANKRALGPIPVA